MISHGSTAIRTYSRVIVNFNVMQQLCTRICALHSHKALNFISYFILETNYMGRFIFREIVFYIGDIPTESCVAKQWCVYKYIKIYLKYYPLRTLTRIACEIFNRNALPFTTSSSNQEKQVYCRLTWRRAQKDLIYSRAT